MSEVRASQAPAPSARIAAPAFPAGEDHEDDYFGHQVIYRGPVTIPAKVTFDGAPRDFDVELRLQGCADAGVCYPPQQQHVVLPLPAAGAGPSAPVEAAPPKKSYFN